jgi:hypothetical protein
MNLRHARMWRAVYSRPFGDRACSDVVAGAEPPVAAHSVNAPQRDGFPAAGMTAIGPYRVLVCSQDPLVKQ